MIRVNSTPHTAEPDAPGVGVSISSRRRWGIVGLLFSASMVNYMDRATVSMALPSISSDLGLGPAARESLACFSRPRGAVFLRGCSISARAPGWCSMGSSYPG
jgi:hypothetical protein